MLKTYASVVWWDGALVRGLLWFSIVFDPSDGQHLDDWFPPIQTHWIRHGRSHFESMDHHNDGYNPHNHHHRSWHLWLIVNGLNHHLTILVGWIANHKRKKKKNTNKNKHKKKGRRDIMRIMRVVCIFLLCSVKFI